MLFSSLSYANPLGSAESLSSHASEMQRMKEELQAESGVVSPDHSLFSSLSTLSFKSFFKAVEDGADVNSREVKPWNKAGYPPIVYAALIGTTSLSLYLSLNASLSLSLSYHD